MRKTSFYIMISGVVVVITVAAVFLAIAGTSKYGTVKGEIADKLSGDPIREVRVVVDGRSTTLYQTTHYQLTKIPPGEHTIKVLPPSGWVKISKPFKVQPGENRANITLKGDKIPDLSKIICFTESKKEKGIVVEVRYVNSEGTGMSRFPQLPIKIDVTLWDRIGKKGNYEKGEKLFEGQIRHFWDSEAHLAKNKGTLPWKKIPVKLEDKKRGIMQIRVHLEQGDFKDTVDEVRLFPKEEKT